MLPNMKNLCFFLLVFFSPFIYAQSDGDPGPPFDYKRDFKNILARTKNKQDTLYYLKLLNRFQENDSSLTPAETLALMIGYTDSRFFKPYENMQTELEIIKLNDKAFYLDVLDESKEYLRTHPLSLSINKERSFAYYMLKKRDSAKYYMKLADKIMEAMIYSGKGRTPETAYFSLGLVDGDYFIPNVGWSIWGKKTDVDRNRHYLYAIDAVSLEDVHKTYYFNIQHAKQKMDLEEDTERLAKEKKPKKKKGVYDPNAINPDSLPPNPADSIILPLSERPKIDSAKIRDSLLRLRNIRDSLRYDSIFIICKADSIREKAIFDSCARIEQVQEELQSDRKTVIPEIPKDVPDSKNQEPMPQAVDSTNLQPTLQPETNKLEESAPSPPATSDSSQMNKNIPAVNNLDFTPQATPASQVTDNNPLSGQNNDTTPKPQYAAEETASPQTPTPVLDSNQTSAIEVLAAPTIGIQDTTQSQLNSNTSDEKINLRAEESDLTTPASQSTGEIIKPNEDVPAVENPIKTEGTDENKNTE
jgi:hypothetical protein